MEKNVNFLSHLPIIRSTLAKPTRKDGELVLTLSIALTPL